MDSKQPIGHRLNQAIKTVEDGNKARFSLKTKKNPAQITRMCQGKARPTMDFLLTLHTQYEIDINWLLTGQGEMIPGAAERPNQPDPTVSNPSESNTVQLSPPMYQTNTSLHMDSGEDGSQFFLEKWEDEGRLAIFSTFPSVIYRDPRSEVEKKRGRAIRNTRKTQHEYYTMAALLLFVFGRIGQKYDRAERIRILKRMIVTFAPARPTVLKHLTLFDSSALEIEGFSNLELVKKDRYALFQTPMQGFLIVESNEVGRLLSDFYSRDNNIPCIRDSDAVSILKLAGESLKKREGITTYLENVDAFNPQYGAMLRHNVSSDD